MTPAIAAALASSGACAGAVAWAWRRRSWRRAWDECPRGDWLLWYAARAGAARPDIVRAAAGCARLVLDPAEDAHPAALAAIEAAEAWAAAPSTETAAAARAAATRAAPSTETAAAARAAAWAARAAGDAWDARVAAWAALEAGATRCAAVVRQHVAFPGPMEIGAGLALAGQGAKEKEQP